MTTAAPSYDGGAAPSSDALDTVLAVRTQGRRPNGLAAASTFGWRSVLKIKHLPEQLFDVTAFPIIMTVMFTYLFGGAIAGSPGEYLDFLLPGILTISIVMITMYTGVSLNTDIAKGTFDRFRSLAIWRPAPMVGYLIGDLVRYAIGAVVILAVGMALGYRPGSVSGTVLAVALVLLFSFAISWVWTLLGLLVDSEKAVMGVSMLVLFPLTFLSNVFVQPHTMPGWLETAVNANPITHLVAAARDAMAGQWNSGEITWVVVASLALIAVFGPATMWLYERK